MDSEDWVTGNIRLTVKGYPLEMQMTVPAKPVKPQRMLPILQQMANSFVDVSVQEAASEGDSVSCKAGCGACCRQAVPISEVEIYQIAELVESMPEPRRSVIKQRFAEGVAHFKKVGWFDKMNSQFQSGKVLPSKEAAKKAIGVAMEYFFEGVPCPFLEDESCSIHPNRPVACREYLVTSPAENCKSPTAETIRVLDLVIKPSRTLKQFAASGRLASYGLLTLIRSLEIAAEVPEEFPEKTGERWMAEFFGKLTESEVPEPAAKPAVSA
jgi:Fe-S-cluster containining protein